MTDYSQYEYIKVEKANTLATVTLNRPDSLNAVNPRPYVGGLAATAASINSSAAVGWATTV